MRRWKCDNCRAFVDETLYENGQTVDLGVVDGWGMPSGWLYLLVFEDARLVANQDNATALVICPKCAASHIKSMLPAKPVPEEAQP